MPCAKYSGGMQGLSGSKYIGGKRSDRKRSTQKKQQGGFFGFMSNLLGVNEKPANNQNQQMTAGQQLNQNQNPNQNQNQNQNQQLLQQLQQISGGKRKGKGTSKGKSKGTRKSKK